MFRFIRIDRSICEKDNFQFCLINVRDLVLDINYPFQKILGV